ncbi:MAG: hypothetical protein J6U17_05200 [Kiritimatiellae bacterium]|nr:hypothetical protein [Kiritimatiellia bacterium]
MSHNTLKPLLAATLVAVCGLSATAATYTASVSGDTDFADIAWAPSAIDDMADAVLQINGSGTVTGGFDAVPSEVVLGSDVTLDMSALPGASAPATTVRKSGSGTLRLSSDMAHSVELAAGRLAVADGVTLTNTILLPGKVNADQAPFLTDAERFNGVVELAALADPKCVNLHEYGNASSTIVLKGLSGASWVTEGSTVSANVRLDGAVVFNNGSSNKTNTFARISGTADLTLAGWSTCSASTYDLKTIDGYTGTLVVSNAITRSEGGTFTVRIGDIVNASAGGCLLKVGRVDVDGATGTVVFDLADGKVDGVAKTLLMTTVDGVYGVYAAAALYRNAVYTSIQAALDDLPEGGDVTLIEVLDSDSTVPAGYKVANGRLAVDAGEDKACIGGRVFPSVYEALRSASIMDPGTVVTVLDASYEDDGTTYRLYFRWNAGSRTYTRKHNYGMGTFSFAATSEEDAKSLISMLPWGAAMDNVTEEEFSTYFLMDAVYDEESGLYKVTIDLDPSVTLFDENEILRKILAAAVAGEETVTFSAKPGLYYWISSGTVPGELTDKLPSVLATNKACVTIPVPAGDLFFRIKVDCMPH